MCAPPRADKYNDGAGFLLHKCKDGGVQWFYRYIIHERCRKIGLRALRRVSLKQACECENQEREAMRNLHYLKDSTLDTFESRKAEWMTVRLVIGLFLYIFIFFPIRLYTGFRDYTNRDT